MVTSSSIAIGGSSTQLSLHWRWRKSTRLFSSLLNLLYYNRAMCYTAWCSLVEPGSRLALCCKVLRVPRRSFFVSLNREINFARRDFPSCLVRAFKYIRIFFFTMDPSLLYYSTLYVVCMGSESGESEGRGQCCSRRAVIGHKSRSHSFSLFHSMDVNSCL